MLELFLESNLFESIAEKKQVLSSVDRTLPEIMWKFGEMVSHSLVLNNLTLERLREERNHLILCIEEGFKLS